VCVGVRTRLVSCSHCQRLTRPQGLHVPQQVVRLDLQLWLYLELGWRMGQLQRAPQTTWPEVPLVRFFAPITHICRRCYLGEKHPWAAPFVNTTYYFLFGYTLWRALAERRGRTASCRGEWLLALLVGGPLGWVGISLISSLICKFIWDYPYWFWEW